jgi:hypothetical protein
MNKPKKANVEKFQKPTAQPVANPQPEAAAKETVQETDEQRQERVDRANKAIREVLKAENCILTVPSLDISTGRVFAQIVLRAQ